MMRNAIVTILTATIGTTFIGWCALVGYCYPGVVTGAFCGFAGLGFVMVLLKNLF